MNEVEIQKHALRIAAWHLSDIEYSNVYEDDELEDASEDDWYAIHYFIQNRLKAVVK